MLAVVGGAACDRAFGLDTRRQDGPIEGDGPIDSDGDVPVVGDWDGDRTTTIGLYRPSDRTFYLRNSNTYGIADLVIPF